MMGRHEDELLLDKMAEVYNAVSKISIDYENRRAKKRKRSKPYDKITLRKEKYQREEFDYRDYL